MKQQQLRYLQTHTKRNGDTLYIDLNNNFSQFICTRLYEKSYNNKIFVHLCIIAHFNFEIRGSWAP